jgi:Putative porin
MKVKSLASLFFALGVTSFSAFAEDKISSSVVAPAQFDAAVAVQTDAAVSAVTIEAAPSVAPSNATQPNTVAIDVPVKADVVRVPYIPEVVMRQIKEEIRQEVLAQAKGERWGDPGALPDWLNRISFDGDFRLRYQRDAFPFDIKKTLPSDYNPTGLTLISNTTDTHNYLRVQAKLGMKAKVSDSTFAAFRLSTGTTTNPVSNNQTLGSGFNKSSLVWDRAYFQSAPYDWVTVSGGKMPNPWLGSDLVWDSDVNFEGVAAQFKQRATEQWSGFLTAGAFPFQDVQRSDTVSANSKWLYGAQLGTKWTAMNASTAQFGIALYDFKDVEGTHNAVSGIQPSSHLFDNTAAQSMQKGNSLMYVNAGGGSPNLLLDPNEKIIYGLTSKFRELNITAKMDWVTFDPVHVMLNGDYVKNLGFDVAEILRRTTPVGLVPQCTTSAGSVPQCSVDLTPKTKGYQVALSVGSTRVKQRGDWQASVAYKYLERDAVLDALTDSDFHLGGTNAKGFVVGGAYGLDKETSLGVRWISTDQIDGPPLSIDSLQVDLSMRF